MVDHEQKVFSSERILIYTKVNPASRSFKQAVLNHSNNRDSKIYLSVLQGRKQVTYFRSLIDLKLHVRSFQALLLRIFDWLLYNPVSSMFLCILMGWLIP